MGADRKLLDWAQGRLVLSSSCSRIRDRIRVDELGKTTEGRPFIAATIAAPETLRNLDRYRDIQAKLADPRTTSEAEAAKLIARGQDGRHDHLLDSFAPKSPLRLTAIEFAYKLLTEDKPKFQAILAEHDLLAGSVAEPRRRGHRDPVVSQNARHAVRGYRPAGAVSQVRRTR